MSKFKDPIWGLIVPVLGFVIALVLMVGVAHAQPACETFEQRMESVSKHDPSTIWVKRGPLYSVKDGSPITKLYDAYSAHRADKSGAPIGGIAIVFADKSTGCLVDSEAVVLSAPPTRDLFLRLTSEKGPEAKLQGEGFEPHNLTASLETPLGDSGSSELSTAAEPQSSPMAGYETLGAILAGVVTAAGALWLAVKKLGTWLRDPYERG